MQVVHLGEQVRSQALPTTLGIGCVDPSHLITRLRVLVVFSDSLARKRRGPACLRQLAKVALEEPLTELLIVFEHPFQKLLFVLANLIFVLRFKVGIRQIIRKSCLLVDHHI